MGFLAPLFLAGAVALGLPVYLHLLRRSQHNPQQFPSLMFFEKRIESSSKQKRLRYRALLAARLALLLAIVLGFSSPFITRSVQSLRKRSVVVIAIDRSFSMRAGDRLSQAKRSAHSVVASLAGGQSAQVLAFDRHVESVTDIENTKETLHSAIDAVQPTDLESSFGELVRALHVMEQTKDAGLEVHLFSDMQATSMPPDFRDLSLGAQTRLLLHAVGGSAPNWAIESVSTAPRVFDVKNTQLSATLTGWATPQASQRVDLVLDGHILSTKSIVIPADGRVTVDFRGFPVPYGAHRGEVRLASTDGLPADNRFLFATERMDPRPVLFLYSHGRARQAFYYKAALDSATDTGLTVEAAPVEQLAGRDLSRYAFLVLHDLGSLDKATEDRLCGYLMAGGGALVAMGPDVLASGRLPLSKSSVSLSRQAQGVGYIDGSSPALQGSGRFESVQFLQTASWQPSKNDRTLARLADNAPLLVDQTVGEGKMLRFAATLDNEGNDFPLHSSYLPFVVQTARFLSGAEEAQASYVAGSAVTLRRSKQAALPVDVIGPDGQHLLSLAQAKGNGSFGLDREGFYEVTRADGHRQLVAAHADRRESDLRPVSAETLALWVNTGSKAGGSETGGSRSETETRRWSFWRYLLALAVGAAVIESILARRYVAEGTRKL